MTALALKLKVKANLMHPNGKIAPPEYFFMKDTQIVYFKLLSILYFYMIILFLMLDRK